MEYVICLSLLCVRIDVTEATFSEALTLMIEQFENSKSQYLVKECACYLKSCISVYICLYDLRALCAFNASFADGTGHLNLCEEMDVEINLLIHITHTHTYRATHTLACESVRHFRGLSVDVSRNVISRMYTFADNVCGIS